MAKDRKKLVHIHSKITDKQPRPEALEVGEIAVNNGVSGSTDRSFLSIKNADNKVVRFSSDEQMIFWTEKKEVIPFEGQVRGEDGPESTKDSGDYGSYGITNNDLLNNKSNLVIKFNQVAASNTPKSEKINGGKDIYNKLVNGTPDASREGAGIAIDMSRYAMRGANPSFSSLTITNGTTLEGDLNVSGNTNVSGDTNVGNNLKVTNGITADTVSATTSIKSPTISGTDITASNSVKADNVSANTITASTSVTTKDLNVSGNAKITGTTDIAGATTINNALTVNGETLLKNTTVDGSLLVNSGATIHNGISVDGGANITGNTNLNGNLTATSISATSVTAPTISGTDITASNSVKANNVSANTITAATSVTTKDLDVSGNGKINNLSAATISGGSAIIGGELSVSGDTTLKNVTASTISASSIETKSGLTHKITFSSGYTPSITNPVFNASADTQVTIPTVGGYPDKAEYNSTDKKIYFKHDNTTLPSMTIDATDFIKDGMVDDAKVENGYLVITFNTDSGKEDIKIPLTDIFNPSNYYTKTDLTATTNYATVRKAYSADTASTVALAGVTNADDLKAIEALTGTSGLLKKTAANTWTLDTTSYSSATQVNTALAGKVPTSRTITTASGLTGGGNLSTDRTIGLSATGTAGTYGPTADVTGTEGTTIKIPQITTDAYGRVTSVTERTLTNKNSTYTVNNGTFAISGNGTSVASTSANASANSGLNIKSGSNVTITTSTNEITIAATDTKYTEGRAIDITNNVVSLDLPISAGTGANAIIENSTSNVANGQYSHAEGSSTQSSGNYSHTEGNSTIASGESSHAEGNHTTANGNTSHAEGLNTLADGYHSHAEGNNTKASGESSHAEGSLTKANGISSHAEGDSTEANGHYSHSEGNSTKANGYYSHAEGYSTVTNNQSEHASGMYNISRTGSIASVKTLFTVGNGTAETARHNAFEIRQNGDIYITSGSTDIKLQDHLGGGGTSYTAGRAIDITNNVVSLDLPISAGTGANAIIENSTSNVANGQYSHAEGRETTAHEEASHSEGYGSKASGYASHSEGFYTIASGTSSHAEGYYTEANGEYSHAEGHGTTASSNSSHAEGVRTTASGNYSHAEGVGTTASGISSHAEGNDTQASGNYSHAEGRSTIASGDYSHAEGQNTKANSSYSHAEGYGTTVSDSFSHAEGLYTVTNNMAEHASGMFNISRTGSTDDAKTLFTVGNGTSDNARNNAFEIRQNGDTYVNGNVTANAFYATSDERLKENIENVSYAKIANAANVNIKSFNFKSDEEKKTVIGVIAQDVEKENLGFIVSTSNDGMKAVDYTGLSLLKIAYLEQKIKELENIINELKQNKQ